MSISKSRQNIGKNMVKASADKRIGELSEFPSSQRLQDSDIFVVETQEGTRGIKSNILIRESNSYMVINGAPGDTVLTAEEIQQTNTIIITQLGEEENPIRPIFTLPDLDPEVKMILNIHGRSPNARSRGSRLTFVHSDGREIYGYGGGDYIDILGQETWKLYWTVRGWEILESPPIGTFVDIIDVMRDDFSYYHNAFLADGRMLDKELFRRTYNIGEWEGKDEGYIPNFNNRFTRYNTNRVSGNFEAGEVGPHTHTTEPHSHRYERAEIFSTRLQIASGSYWTLDSINRTTEPETVKVNPNTEAETRPDNIAVKRYFYY